MQQLALDKSQLAKRVVGQNGTVREEVNGYIFWTAIAAFIAIPEPLAAFPKTMKENGGNRKR